MKHLLLLFFAATLSGGTGSAQETATVHLYRFRDKRAVGIHPSVFCDKEELFRLQNGRVLTVQMAPGRHFLICNSKTGGVTIDLLPGVDYYFRFDLKPDGFLPGSEHFAVTPVSVDEGREETAGLKNLDSKWERGPACQR